MPNILHIGTFCALQPARNFFASTPSTDWILADGFRKLGYQVYEINTLTNTAQQVLAAINILVRARHYEFALFGNVFLGLGVLGRITLDKCRQHQVPAVIWHGDVRRTLEPSLVQVARNAQFLFMTTGGERLRNYKTVTGVPVAAYLFNPAYNYPNLTHDPPGSPTYDLMFAGGKANDAAIKNADGLRDEIMQDLPSHSDKFGYTIFTPGYNQKRVIGEEYIRAIRRTRIGLGINRFVDCEKYTSDRMSQFMANGAFYICNQNPGLETMFKDHEHLLFFKDREGCFFSIEEALAMEPAEFNKIRKAGQDYILNNFGHKTVCQYMVDIIKGKKPGVTWGEVYQ